MVVSLHKIIFITDMIEAFYEEHFITVYWTAASKFVLKNYSSVCQRIQILCNNIFYLD